MAQLTAISPANASVWTRIALLRCNDPFCLYPPWQRDSDAAIERANARGADVVSWETCRSNALQQIYYEQHTSNAQNALRSAHFFGYARDVISASRHWSVYPSQRADGTWVGGDPEWMGIVCEEFKAVGAQWGGDWGHTKDFPHWYARGWSTTPTDEMVQLYHTGGLAAVWERFGLNATNA